MDAARWLLRRLWRRLPGSARLVPAGVCLVVAAGTAAGAVLATVGGTGPQTRTPATQPSPGSSASPVVPLLGGGPGAPARGGGRRRFRGNAGRLASDAAALITANVITLR